jgi:hypothetical protein
MALSQGPGNGKQADPLEVIRYYLGTAIQLGAPAYNHGDQRGCYEVYACTARLLVHAVQGAEDARRLLREALEQCSTVVDVDRQAWTMRRAFDALLLPSEAGDRSPEV